MLPDPLPTDEVFDDVDAEGSEDGDTTETKAKGKESQATVLVKLVRASGAELFHDADKSPYARLPVCEHYEVWSLRSKPFRRWLSRLHYQLARKAPRAQAIQDALNILEGDAVFGGTERAIHVRMAEHGDSIYLDLCDVEWRMVKVESTGWCVVDQSPVLFRRAPGMLALPMPVGGGSVDDLRGLVNVPDGDAWALIIAWLLAAFRASGPYPVLAVSGEHGSAKTTLARMLRQTVDPNTCELRAEPKEVRDLMIAATNGWAVAFDNLSYLSPWLSDALCRLATGGGFATRELYSDDAERLFTAQRPVILNGIEEVATRPDLLDRTINICLPTIDEKSRRTERDLWARFETLRPRILGALLAGVAGGLRDVSSVRLAGLPRMADFAVWAVATEKHVGQKAGAFRRAYDGSREESVRAAVEASAVGPALLAFVERAGSWSGIATELLAQLDAQCFPSPTARKPHGWPGSGRALSGHVRRLAPNLRRLGVEVRLEREPGGERRRLIHLAHAGKRPSQPSPSVPNEPGGDEGGGERDGMNLAGDDDSDGDRPHETHSGVQESSPPDGRDGRDDVSPDLSPAVDLARDEADRAAISWSREQGA